MGIEGAQTGMRRVTSFFALRVGQIGRMVTAFFFWWSGPFMRVTTHMWCRLDLRLADLLAGLKVQAFGLENIPNKPVIFASKHQSQFEVITLLAWFPKAVFVVKQELVKIPFVGWAGLNIGHIPVNREEGAKAIRPMIRLAKERIASGFSIIIFPEGTRRPLGAAPDYKPGVYELYRTLGVPVIPVGLNSAVFTNPKRWQIEPGTVTLSFLPAIQPGLDRDTFTSQLIEMVETETARLVTEAKGEGVASSGINRV